MRRYSGGMNSRISEKNEHLDPLDTPSRLQTYDDPAGYIASKQVTDAVNVALLLRQPLLVTGEPGTGKTELAGSIAYDLGLDSPLIFNAKTTSVARDLFYRYDAIRHFQDAQLRSIEQNVEKYIRYEALGIAILRTLPAGQRPRTIISGHGYEEPRSSVVLVDEVDKAPRDLPNDILIEIERCQFAVPELGLEFTADRRYGPIVVFTSNAESVLPDPFLRRCVFCHIPFPDQEHLRSIMFRRLGHGDSRWAEAVIRRFEAIRALPLRKKPSTAEFLAWVQILARMQIDPSVPDQQSALAATFSILAKNEEDLIVIQHEGH